MGAPYAAPGQSRPGLAFLGFRKSLMGDRCFELCGICECLAPQVGAGWLELGVAWVLRSHAMLQRPFSNFCTSLSRMQPMAESWSKPDSRCYAKGNVSHNYVEGWHVQFQSGHSLHRAPHLAWWRLSLTQLCFPCFTDVWKSWLWDLRRNAPRSPD